MASEKRWASAGDESKEKPFVGELPPATRRKGACGFCGKEVGGNSYLWKGLVKVFYCDKPGCVGRAEREG